MIIKRDGTIEGFNSDKIVVAVNKACQSTGEKMLGQEVADQIERKVGEKTSISEIEGMVFDVLIELSPITARSYEAYRAVREEQREWNSIYDDVLSITNRTDMTTLSENSNKNDKLLSTQRDLMAGQVSKHITRKSMFSTQAIQAHDDGVIHIHDLDYDIQQMFNCCLVNLDDMLRNGTVINGKTIDTPRSFRTACTVATQIVQQVANGQYGGQTISVTHLAPYVRVSEEKIFAQHYERLSEIMKDEDDVAILELASKLTDEDLRQEIKDGVQTIQYQINTFSSTNGQAPFLSLYIDVMEDPAYSAEVAMIAEEVFKQRIKGIKNEKGVWSTPAFPKLLYVLRDETTKGGEFYELTQLAHECTAKRMNPDYISAKIMEQNYGDVFPCMGCRSFLAPYQKERKWYGRFNQGVCTINLVDVALSVKTLDDFFNLLEERLELVKEVLMVKHRKLLGTLSDVSPIHWQHGAIARLGKGEVIDPFLFDGYSTISVGYIGLAETVEHITGQSITEQTANELAKDIMFFMDQKVKQFKEDENIGFSLYGTPAESTAGRFAECLQEKFGNIPNVTDKGYITNSHHVPVDVEIMPFDKLKQEAVFQDIALGGSISYVEATNLQYNLDIMESLTEFISENIQYAEVNGKSDYCYICSYDGEILIDTKDNTWFCPECGNKDQDQMNVVRRTCGYLGENFWGEGRTKEIGERFVHIENHEM